jgi:mRNA interferase MazF
VTNEEPPSPVADPKRGDLYWIALEDASGVPPPYAHPHVVVQDDVFNRSRVSTVIVCALSTNLVKAGEPGNVLLDPGEGNLPKQSVVVVSQISSVEKRRLGTRIGTLTQERVDQIVAGLQFQQTSYFRRR